MLENRIESSDGPNKLLAEETLPQLEKAITILDLDVAVSSVRNLLRGYKALAIDQNIDAVFFRGKYLAPSDIVKKRKSLGIKKHFLPENVRSTYYDYCLDEIVVEFKDPIGYGKQRAHFLAQGGKIKEIADILYVRDKNDRYVARIDYNTLHVDAQMIDNFLKYIGTQSWLYPR